jgi:hypothetical protein
VVGGCGGIAAPGICAADRGEFTHDKKRRIRIVAQLLARAGKTVVFDILIRPRERDDWRVERSGIPHLANNERDVGHPGVVAGSKFSELDCHGELKLPGQ